MFIKKYNTLVHVLTFAIVDFTTLFFAGAALYRVSGHLDKFAEWNPIKQGHIAGGTTSNILGIIFLVLVIVQHAGGVMSFLGKKPNPQHRQFGKILVHIGRCIAAFGWILGGHQQNAMIVAGVSGVLLLLALVSGGSSPSDRKRDASDTQRSRSPKGKR